MLVGNQDYVVSVLCFAYIIIYSCSVCHIPLHVSAILIPGAQKSVYIADRFHPFGIQSCKSVGTALDVVWNFVF